MSKPWNGLVKLIELKIVDLEGKVLFKKENINNVLHYGGQELILSCMFSNTSIPPIYYVGLDSRPTISPADTMNTIETSGMEPNGNGYARQPLVRGTSNLVINSIAQPPKVTSSTITFSYTGSGTGYTATDMFLCTDLSGYDTETNILISTVSFGTTITVSSNNVVSMKFAMVLNGC